MTVGPTIVPALSTTVGALGQAVEIDWCIIDRDDDSDLADFAGFQAAFTGEP
ncbi:MAG: hypothetical protein JSU86_13230 [Phycisphaerales bacterium]|nr:MAG: hypothetical protein JSU86_13230 [Phycisphaerales bacterium]